MPCLSQSLGLEVKGREGLQIGGNGGNVKLTN